MSSPRLVKARWWVRSWFQDALGACVITDCERKECWLVCIRYVMFFLVVLYLYTFNF
jgi:hypothetical protein